MQDIHLHHKSKLHRCHPYMSSSLSSKKSLDHNRLLSISQIDKIEVVVEIQMDSVKFDISIKKEKTIFLMK
jgi:hypothetical protein